MLSLKFENRYYRILRMTQHSVMTDSEEFGNTGAAVPKHLISTPFCLSLPPFITDKLCPAGTKSSHCDTAFTYLQGLIYGGINCIKASSHFIKIITPIIHCYSSVNFMFEYSSILFPLFKRFLCIGICHYQYTDCYIFIFLVYIYTYVCVCVFLGILPCEVLSGMCTFSGCIIFLQYNFYLLIYC